MVIYVLTSYLCFGDFYDVIRTENSCNFLRRNTIKREAPTALPHFESRIYMDLFKRAFFLFFLIMSVCSNAELNTICGAPHAIVTSPR